MHPAPLPVTLNCPGPPSCPTSSAYTVAATNPYCEQTYTNCGCIGDGCVTYGSGGGGGGGGSCGSDPPSGSGGEARGGRVQGNDQDCDPCDPDGCSPIIVDTDGRGFHLTSASAGATFDIKGNGHPVKISWTAENSTNAFLALDRNHNGRIDSGKELFGNFAAQPPSPNPNGYLALAEFDKPENGGNGDGIIDWHDAVYSKLLLWIDENHDGISQPNELHSLPELGVFSISLKYRKEPFVDEYGNSFRYRGVLNPDPLDGESKDGRYTYDVFFRLDDPSAGVRKPWAAPGILAAERRLQLDLLELLVLYPTAKPEENRYPAQNNQ